MIDKKRIPTCWFSVVEIDESDRIPYAGNGYTAYPEEIAEYYHAECDGWENSDWPLTFVLYDTEDGPEIGRYKVELEYDPVFTATEVVKDDLTKAPE